MKASEKYADAIKLYRETDLTLTEISRRCGLSRSAFAIYIQRNHRDLMYSRHSLDPHADTTARLRTSKGQSAAARKKYRAAILACDSEEYLHFNISQIAAKFGLNASSLANQLANHYPEIKMRREELKRKMGLSDKQHLGARQTSEDRYAPAIEMLKDRDITFKEAARLCGVSYSGLRQHILFYHKELSEQRSKNKE